MVADCMACCVEHDAVWRMVSGTSTRGPVAGSSGYRWYLFSVGTLSAAAPGAKWKVTMECSPVGAVWVASTVSYVGRLVVVVAWYLGRMQWLATK